MDPRVMKLAANGLDRDAAQALVDAGVDTPRKIKAARVTDLRKIVKDIDKVPAVARWRAAS